MEQLAYAVDVSEALYETLTQQLGAMTESSLKLQHQNHIEDKPFAMSSRAHN